MKRDLAADHRWTTAMVRGQSPQTLNFVANYEHLRHATWVSPAYNNEVFERPQVFKAFFLILLLIIIGEFFR